MIGLSRKMNLGTITYFKVKKVGIGFMNNWGGQTVTFLIDQLSIEGAGIKPFSVEPGNKLATTWGNLKID